MRALVATSALLALGASQLACAGEEPVSILVVTLDTLRADHVGAYGGGEGLTPNLDALAAEGLVHDAAFTTMPTTGPAHLSLFTGLYPAEHGGRANAQPLRSEHAGRDLAARLRDAGWTTAAFVAIKLIDAERTGLRGFQIYDAPGGLRRSGRQVVDSVLAWLEIEARRPVLLWVHLYDAHAPYGTHEEKLVADVKRVPHGFVREHYADATLRLEMRRAYARGVQEADRELGRLVEGVRDRMATPPLVVVVADHGESFDEHLVERSYAYDHGEYLDPETVVIPLVLAGPGVTPGRSPGPASIRDLYTTLLEAAGVGDPTAEAEKRRDLRVESSAQRVVRIERRTFTSRVPASVRRHAAAAADGERVVVVGEDGRPAGPNAPRALLREARAGLAPVEPAPPLDPETREALRELGYVE